MKITDSPDDDPQKQKDTPIFDRRNLAKLYPTAKTYEQKQQERLELEIKIIGRQPRHVILLVGLCMYGLVVLAALIISAAPRLIMWNVISGVFLSFLLSMIFTGVVYALSNVMRDALAVKKLKFAPFFMIYLILILPLTLAIVYLLRLSWPFDAIVASVLHFIFVTIALSVMDSSAKKQQ